MHLNQNLDKSKPYVRVSLNCKLLISSDAIRQLQKPTADISDDVIRELKELGAIVIYKSVETADQHGVVTLTPFGDMLANRVRQYKV